MTSAHHELHAHGPIEYRFCPRCGGGLERRAIKTIEPKRLVCQTCSFIFYQDPKVVAGTIFTLDRRLVLLKRGVEPALGKWVFPGGYVDRGETVEEAARRETREESQLEVVIGSLLNVYSYPRSPNVIIVYAAQIVGGNLAAGEESVEAATFLPDEVPWQDLAFDSTRDALRDYIRIYMNG